MATEYVPLEAVKAVVCETCEKPSCPELWGGDCSLMGLLNDLPAADVVEVVRCGECSFRGKETHICSVSGMCVASDGFCAWGQRRADNG